MVFTDISAERIFEYGDVIEAAQICDELETKLNALKRLKMLADHDWRESLEAIEVIRARLLEALR